MSEHLTSVPRLYAAASLKPRPAAALDAVELRVPRLYAAASLKLDARGRHMDITFDVFRGYMPRPH